MKIKDEKIFERLLLLKKEKGITFNELVEPLKGRITATGIQLAIGRHSMDKMYLDTIIRAHGFDRDFIYEGSSQDNDYNKGAFHEALTAKEILEEIKKFYGYKMNSHLAKRLGISNQLLYNWKDRNSMDVELVERKCPEISSEFIRKGIKPVKKGVHLEESISTNHSQKLIPVYNFEIAASNAALNNDESQRIIGYLSIPGTTESSDKAVIVAGNSMHPKYPSGSFIAVRQITEFNVIIEPGLAYVIETREQQMLKYLRYDEENPDNFIAVSENKNYQSFKVPKSAIIRLWKVMGSASKDAIT